MNFRKLTMPEAKGEIWVNLDKINAMLPQPNGGTFLEVTGQQAIEGNAFGFIVIESPAEILGLPKDAITTSN